MNNAAVPVAGDLYLSKGEIKMPQTKDEKKQIIETLGEKHATFKEAIEQEVNGLSESVLLDSRNLKNLQKNIKTLMRRNIELEHPFYNSVQEFPNSNEELARELGISAAALSKTLSEFKYERSKKNAEYMRWFVKCISLISGLSAHRLLEMSNSSPFPFDYIKVEPKKEIIPIIFDNDCDYCCKSLIVNLCLSADKKRRDVFNYIIEFFGHGLEKRDDLFSVLKIIVKMKKIDITVSDNLYDKTKAIKVSTSPYNRKIQDIYYSNIELTKYLAVLAAKDETVEIMDFLFAKCGFLEDGRKTVKNDE